MDSYLGESRTLHTSNTLGGIVAAPSLKDLCVTEASSSGKQANWLLQH